MSSFCTSRESRYDNEHSVGKSAENREEEAADDTGPQDLQQELAAIGEVRGGEEHEVAVDDDEEEVAEHGGGARQETVRLFAGLRRTEAEEQRSSVIAAVDAVGDEI